LYWRMLLLSMAVSFVVWLIMFALVGWTIFSLV
jgi:hypothetical protein